MVTQAIAALARYFVYGLNSTGQVAPLGSALTYEHANRIMASADGVAWISRAGRTVVARQGSN